MAAAPVYTPPSSRATLANVLLALCGASALLSLALETRLYGEAGDRGMALNLDPDGVFDTVQVQYQLSVLLSLLLLAVSTVTFLTWFHQVRVNAELFDPYGHRRSRGWAIAGWFVPVVAFWFPRQIAGDVWQASARPDDLGVRAPQSQTLLNWWWAAFLGFCLLGRIGQRLNDDAVDADTYRQSMLWLIASDAAEVAAAVLAVLLVRRLTAAQEARVAEHWAKVQQTATLTRA